MRGFTGGLAVSLGAGVLLGLAIGSAGAAEWVPPAAPSDTQIELRFERLDKDGDHRVSASEARPYPALTAAFPALDEDEDGVLSLAEFARARTQVRVLSEVFTF